jgi:hypothetical protein
VRPAQSASALSVVRSSFAYVTDFGTGEPWLAWPAVGLPSMVNTVPAFRETRDAFHSACTADLIPALSKAFADLRRLREVLAEPPQP